MSLPRATAAYGNAILTFSTFDSFLHLSSTVNEKLSAVGFHPLASLPNPQQHPRRELPSRLNRCGEEREAITAVVKVSESCQACHIRVCDIKGKSENCPAILQFQLTKSRWNDYPGVCRDGKFPCEPFARIRRLDAFLDALAEETRRSRRSLRQTPG